jgi:hypothetical protein
MRHTVHNVLSEALSTENFNNRRLFAVYFRAMPPHIDLYDIFSTLRFIAIL